MAPPDTSFGDALRRLREAAGLTQEQLADRAGLSFNAISSLERGERQRPYPHTLGALSAALSLSRQQRAQLEELIPPRGHRHEPPAVLAPILGRASELQAIQAILSHGETRLLTLTGPGGVGKTRLALAAAELLAPRFRDGVAVVSLSAVRDHNLVIPSIVRGLDLREWGPPSTTEMLVSYLRRRSALLVLDNFEHLLPAAPEIAGLLAAAPRLHVLATSRGPLALQGERLFAVPPLSQPFSTELFLQRSAALSPTLQETGRVSPKSACDLTIYRWRSSWPPLRHECCLRSALLAQLEAGTSILTSRARDVPDRHRSLRQTIAWSHDLLAEAERQLFRRLAVLAGSWTLEAAAAIGGVDQAAAIDLHRSLVDASLIVRRPAENEVRFAMLETIRVFAAEQLHAHGETQLTRHRHAQHYQGLVASEGAHLWSADQPHALDQLQVEHDNVRVAVEWLLEHGKLDEVARIAYAEWLFWWIRGFHREGGRWVETALAVRAQPSDATRAKLLFTSASMIMPQGRNELAAARLDEAARMARANGDGSTLAWALIQRGYIALTVNDPEGAASTLEAAVIACNAIGDRHGRAVAYIGQAQVALARGQLADVDEQLSTIDSEVRSLEMPWLLAIVLNARARLALALDDADTVTTVMTEALGLLASLRDSWAIRYPLAYLATAAAMQCKLERAALLYGVADAFSERSGNVSNFPVPQLVSDRYRAQTASQLGSPAFQDLVEQGRALPFDQALAFAGNTHS